MKKILNLLFWSVIAAAFIGPGTITTAARAGSDFGFALAWALLFSIIACLVLQEASARITVVAGAELGEAIGRRFGDSGRGRWIPIAVAIGIALGCAAYEAGNLLGGIAGVKLVFNLPPQALTAVTGVAAAALLATGSTRWIARSLGLLVAVMGVAFLVTAFRLQPDIWALLGGLCVPTLPAGSILLVLALVGTTVVPYNLFLGSALARDSSLGEMRSVLAVAVIGGGIISLGVLVVGTALGGGMDFESLGAVLGDRLGHGAQYSLAVGLFAAGFTSAITAPLAAALAWRSLVAPSDESWSTGSPRFRAVCLTVLAAGMAFGLAGVQPIPVIILAQAFNGLLLPLIAIFLWMTMNDRDLLGAEGVNTPAQNRLLGAVVLVCIALGLRALWGAAVKVLALLS